MKVMDLERGAATTDMLRGASPLSAPVTAEAMVNGMLAVNWEEAWTLAKHRLYVITRERGTDMDGTALMCLWIDGMATFYHALIESQGVRVTRAAVLDFLADGIIGSGQGPAVPTFDDIDRAQEANRRYVIVDAASYERLRDFMHGEIPEDE